MKKRKTYEVSIINKTYSKTYLDQTRFYTSDTALELNFQLKEVEYDFDSAEIILLNVDDRSLVTRPVVKSAEGFTYELEDDIVERYGEWKGQLKFNDDGEIYVSSPVSFRIENDLSNDRPPQLTEVNNWKNLRAIADGLIADIRSELSSVAERLPEIESAEATRVSAEEQRKIDHANRSVELEDSRLGKPTLGDKIREVDYELLSLIGERSRLLYKEGFRPASSNEQTNYWLINGPTLSKGVRYALEFIPNETFTHDGIQFGTAGSSVTMVDTAAGKIDFAAGESYWVDNYVPSQENLGYVRIIGNALKIDKINVYTYEYGEGLIDSKADKVVGLDDFITFQDFVGGRNLVLNTSDTIFKEITITNSTHLAPYNTELKLEQDSTYTISMFIGDLPTPVSIDIGTGNEYGYLTHQQTNVLPLKPNQVNTFVVTFSSKISKYRALYIRFRASQADNIVVRFNELKVTKGSTVYPYTKAPEDFSEVTQRDIDEYMATTLPSISDLTVKANKQQEDWITPTLLNGATVKPPSGVTITDVGYRYYDNGIVRLRGTLIGASLFTTLFILPAGYRPTQEIKKVISAKNAFGLLRIYTNGNVVQALGSLDEIVLDDIEFDVR